jgi:hypothetical protein
MAKLQQHKSSRRGSSSRIKATAVLEDEAAQAAAEAQAAHKTL